MGIVTALGLLEPERPTEPVAYGNLIQGVNRFLLEQLYRESSNQEDIKSQIEKIYSYKMSSITRCHCGQEQAREIDPFVIDMLYFKSVLLGTNTSPQKNVKLTFTSVLQQSLNKETFLKAWCPSCKKYERMTQMRVLKAAPKILNLNANVMDQEDKDIWVTAGSSWLPKRVGLNVSEEALSVLNLDDSDTVPEGYFEYELTVRHLSIILSSVVSSHIMFADSLLCWRSNQKKESKIWWPKYEVIFFWNRTKILLT